jgi:hypothetical protein
LPAIKVRRMGTQMIAAIANRRMSRFKMWMGSPSSTFRVALPAILWCILADGLRANFTLARLVNMTYTPNGESARMWWEAA